MEGHVHPRVFVAQLDDMAQPSGGGGLPGLALSPKQSVAGAILKPGFLSCPFGAFGLGERLGIGLPGGCPGVGGSLSVLV